MIQISKGPPPPKIGGAHPACGTPNPPWFCEEPSADIGIYVPIMIFIGVVLGFIIKGNKF